MGEDEMATQTPAQISTARVEDQLPDEILPTPFRPWPEKEFRPMSCIKSGALLGAIAGCVTIAMNVIGSVVWPAISGEPQHPLRLIQVFLTFPLGESALRLESGWLLGFGCLLFLVTGMLYGMLFEFAISYYLPHVGVVGRVLFFTLLALLVWIVNFYAVLSWTQPLFFGGHWILDLIPWRVACLTHLVFGWTMAILYPWGGYSAGNLREVRL
jgi:hypothetical protein